VFTDCIGVFMRLPFFSNAQAGSKRRSSKKARQAEPIQTAPTVEAAAEGFNQTEPAWPVEEPQNVAPTAGPSDQTDPSDQIGSATAAESAKTEDSLDDWLARATAARERGNTDEARALLESAAQLFPQAVVPKHELARMAEAGRDWPEAERWWREFAAIAPDIWWGPTQIANTLRLQERFADADVVLAEAAERFPYELLVLISYARMADTRRDWPEAGLRWAMITARFPDVVDGVTGQGRALREQGQSDEARALLEGAAERFPTSIGPVHELARLAEVTRDWPAAERWWREAQILDAQSWPGYVRLATALREQQRIAEAEEVLSSQFERHAGEPIIFIEHAMLAERSADWPEALRRWDVVTSRFPDRWDSYVGRARALRQHGDFPAAELVLTDALERFPTATQPVHDLVRLAEALNEWSAAEYYWRRYLSLDPSPWWAYLGLATALRQQQRIAEAEEVLSSQFEHHAGQPIIFIEHARLAERSTDWPEAASRWDDVLTRFPDRSGEFGDHVRNLHKMADAAAIQHS
jgi:tetratricopeptide (TPR) repeat protein